MARLEVDFSWEKFDTILNFHPTKIMCTEIMGVSADTIENRIRDNYDMTFTDYRDLKSSNMKLKLQQTMIKKALSGETIPLIFCLKNLCKWQDKIDVDVAKEDRKPLTLNYKLRD